MSLENTTLGLSYIGPVSGEHLTPGSGDVYWEQSNIVAILGSNLVSRLLKELFKQNYIFIMHDRVTY